MNPTNSPSLLQTWTLGMWSGCLLVGLLGGVLKYPRELVKPVEPPPVVARLTVELPPPPPAAGGPAPAEAVSPAPPVQDAPPDPPPPPDVAPPPEAPPLAVAAPAPQISFAVPVQGPVTIVPPKAAAPVVRLPAPPAPPAPAIRHLTLGVGEGRQPNPEYPREARLANEEGTVAVRFTVGEDGRVLAAEVIKPARSVLLNRSALQTIRNQWRFDPGAVRTYDIAIKFELVDN